MYQEMKKLQLIEEILKIEDATVLEEVETVITKNKLQIVKSGSFKEFSGIWIKAEAEEMKKNIADSCEQINPDDWK